MASTSPSHGDQTAPADAERTAEMIRILLGLADAAQAVVADVLAEFDVTASAAGVLWALAPGGEPTTLREIAGRLRCDPSTVSLTADKLESLGLVVRQPHPKDGRKRTLILTDRGYELWDAISTRLHGARLFTGLDTSERDALYGLLAQVQLPQQP
ncbi:MarR family transcriptional regulator [Labedella phragmitis]|uniref:MarR family transcriptional regulator n=2 Tax=Labedella TaxID=390250 RepID=A0A3S4ASC4_9MICO|nr:MULTISPECIES: MarR family transcriptional regulator [Labedella]RWZ46041.1 MarR family transcriptional regulator [Labedella phragmitis]RWZ54812.1 MarR family transcriptional regulator [Labedella populi]